MNRQLQPKGITAKEVALKDSCLQIMLESAQLPDQQTLVAWVHKSITDLGANSIERIRVYGRQTGEEFPAWSQEFELVALPTLCLEEGLGYTQNSEPVIHKEQSNNQKVYSSFRQRHTKAKIKTLSFVERLSLAIFSFIVLFIVGIVLLLIPLIGWILGSISLLAAIGYPLALIIGDSNYISSLVGSCPYCGSEVTAPMHKKSKDCEYCKSKIIIREHKFFTVEK